MEDKRFDAITRALATGGNRRRILRGLAGSTAGGVLAWAGRGRARAQDECPVKVGICHQSRTGKFRFIRVCADAVPAHARHGDLVACPGAGVIDRETCTCVCPLSDADCPGNALVDVDGCACVCPVEEITCLNLEVLDEEACECVCPVEEITCLNLEVLDEEACECVCPVEEIVCEDGQTLNPETCECEGDDGCGGGGTCTVDDDCCPGETCVGGICSVGVCEGRTCGNFAQCHPTADCQCYTAAEGAGVCGCNTLCSVAAPCTTTAECGVGAFCAVNSCCGAAGVCLPICSTGSTCQLGVGIAAVGSRPTSSGR